MFCQKTYNIYLCDKFTRHTCFHDIWHLNYSYSFRAGIWCNHWVNILEMQEQSARISSFFPSYCTSLRLPNTVHPSRFPYMNNSYCLQKNCVLQHDKQMFLHEFITNKMVNLMFLHVIYWILHVPKCIPQLSNFTKCLWEYKKNPNSRIRNWRFVKDTE